MRLELYKLRLGNWALSDTDEGSSALLPDSDANGAWTDSDYSESGVVVRDALLS